MRAMRIHRWALASGLLVLLLALPVAAQTSWNWEQISAAASPGERHSYGMSSHAATGKVIVQGGTYSSGGEAWDHWEWDGTTWTRKTFTTANPYEITDHAMAYDSLRKKTVIFGGWRSGSGNPYQNVTWTYDGKNWTKLTISGPPGREKSALAFDKKKKVMVLFGGYGGNTRYGDTWTFNGTAWKKAATTGPAGRLRHATAYDEKRKAVVMFGGYTDAGYSGETWIWKKNKWKRVATTGPSPRIGHAMAYDPVSGVVILFGGQNGPWPDYTWLDDTWIWNGSKWTQLEISGPSARCNVRMVYMEKLKKIVLYGGDDPYPFSAMADLWVLNR